MMSVGNISSNLLTSNNSFYPSDLDNLALWLGSDYSSPIRSDGAAQFVAANSEDLSIIDNTSLSTGDIDFWMAGWFYFDTKTAFMGLISKDKSSGNQREFDLRYLNTTDRISFLVSNDGSTTNTVVADTFGSPPTSTWMFILAWHDSVNNTINIQIDNGTVDSAAHTTGVFNSTTGFYIGSRLDGSASYLDGRSQHVVFGKNPPDGIAGVISTISSVLYNSGNGLSLENVTDVQRTAWGVESWWKLNEISGARIDSLGTNHLTDNNTVTEAVGKVTGEATTDGAVVNQEIDLSGNSRNMLQSTVALKPTYQLNEQNSKPTISFDGLDDFLSIANFVTLGNSDTEISVFVVVKGVAQSEKIIIGQWDNGINQRSWFMSTGFTDTAKLEVALSEGGTSANKYYESSISAFGDSAYHIIGFVYNNGTLNLYIDSVTADASPNKLIDTAITTLHNSTASIHEGSYLTSGSPANFFNGLIAEPLIYSRALSSNEILRLITYLSNKYAIILS